MLTITVTYENGQVDVYRAVPDDERLAWLWDADARRLNGVVSVSVSGRADG